MSRADLKRLTGGATVWYDPESRTWWMNTATPRTNYKRLDAAPRAIACTNAYELLSNDALDQMAIEAGWLKIGVQGCPRSDDLEAGRPAAPPEIPVSGCCEQTGDLADRSEKCAIVTGGEPSASDRLRRFIRRLTGR